MKRYIFVAILIVGLGLPITLSSKSTSPVTPPPTKSYVALGDSVAAGVGLKNDSDSSACDRTNESYPNQVASALHYKLKNLACSGATLPKGILGSQDVNQLAVPAQISQLFTRPRPDLISLTIGANDAKWTSVISKCYTAQCGTSEDTAAVNLLLGTVDSNIRAALTQIQQHYVTSVPQVVVTGYHQVFPSSSSGCNDLTGIDAAELSWGRQQQASLNATLQQAIGDFPFAVFAPVDFSGHELCTPDSWVQGVYDKQPYHPTESGQAAFAKKVIAAVKARQGL